MGGCSIRGCKKRSEKKEDGISFHAFPFQPYFQQKWINATGRVQWIPKKSAKICSVHFNDNDFTYQRKVPQLRSNAIPVKYIHNTNVSVTTEEYRRPNLNYKNIVKNSSHSKNWTYTKKKLYLNSEPVNKKSKRNDDSEGDENSCDTQDEYDAWAKEWARELRQMEPDQQNFAKRAITYILMEGRLGLLQKNSVQINNKFPDEQTTQEDVNSSSLDDFLVIRNKYDGFSLVCYAPSSSSQSIIDTGTSFKSVSQKSTVRSSHAKSKLKKNTANVVTASCKTATSVGSSCNTATSVGSSCKTATSVGSSSYDNTGTSFVVASHTTAVPLSTSSLPLETMPLHDPGPNVVAAPQKETVTSDCSSIYIKLEPEPFDNTEPNSNEVEPFDDTGTVSLSASHETSAAVRRSPTIVKSEPNSRPSSPDFMVVVKEEPE